MKKKIYYRVQGPTANILNEQQYIETVMWYADSLFVKRDLLNEYLLNRFSPLELLAMNGEDYHQRMEEWRECCMIEAGKHMVDIGWQEKEIEI